jgi:hypothetical protein
MTNSVAWKVRSSDLFDRDSAVHIDASGVGLVDGLVELWRRVLSEGIRDSGQRTFTDFDLSWDGNHTDAGTQPFDNLEIARIRGWVYGTPGPFEGSAYERRIVRHCWPARTHHCFVRSPRRMRDFRRAQPHTPPAMALTHLRGSCVLPRERVPPRPSSRPCSRRSRRDVGDLSNRGLQARGGVHVSVGMPRYIGEWPTPIVKNAPARSAARCPLIWRRAPVH